MPSLARSELQVNRLSDRQPNPDIPSPSGYSAGALGRLSADAPAVGLRGAESALGINARFVAVSGAELAEYQSRRWARYRLQASARALLKAHRDGELVAEGHDLAELRADGFGACDSRLGYHKVTRCMWSRWSSDGVTVTHSASRGRAGYKGLVTCASWSACPICSATISERRRRELAEGVRIARGWGYVVGLATLTRPHLAGDDLAQVADDLAGDVRRMRAHWRWRGLVARYGIEGANGRGQDSRLVRSVRSLETTWGYNGWHPHQHILFFLPAGSDVAEFESELRDLWYSAQGGREACDPETGELLGSPADSDRWEHGCKVTCNDGEVAEYLTKWGHEPKWDVAQEVAKSPSKHGRSSVFRSAHYTPLDLLWSYTEGRVRRHGLLFLEYALAMKGRKQLVWSPGLRDLLGLGGEQSDEEVAEDSSDDLVELVGVDDLTWHLVRRVGRRAELLEVADGGDVELVAGWLGDLWRGGVISDELDQVCSDGEQGEYLGRGSPGQLPGLRAPALRYQVPRVG